MSDDNKPKLGTRAPLGLNKAVAVGQVKQTFSHGRSKQVVVEVKRARVLHRPGDAAPEPLRLALLQGVGVAPAGGEGEIGLRVGGHAGIIAAVRNRNIGALP